MTSAIIQCAIQNVYYAKTKENPMTKQRLSGGLLLGLLSLLTIAACSNKDAELATTANVAEAKPTIEDVRAFLEKTEADLDALYTESSRVNWAYETDITQEHEQAVAADSAKLTRKLVDLANETKKFHGMTLPVDMQRKIDFLRGGITIPAPSTDGAAKQLAEINTRLTSAYSTGKIEFSGNIVPQDETELLMRELKDPKQLEEVWTKWRENSKAMKADFVEMVRIANEGARELGYKDVGHMWRSGYDMDADAFIQETDRLWGQVQP